MKKKYATPRRTEIVYEDQLEEPPPAEEDDLPDYPVHLFLSREGYFKKITPQSLRMSGEQKYKEGDGPCLPLGGRQPGRSCWSSPTGSSATRPSSGTSTTPRPASWGTTCPPSWSMEEGEAILWACLARGLHRPPPLLLRKRQGGPGPPGQPTRPQTRRKKLTGAYSDKSPLKDVLFLPEGQEEEVVLYSTEGRALLLQTDGIPVKTTRSTQGVQVMTLKKTNTGGPRRPPGPDGHREPGPLPGPEPPGCGGAAEDGGSGGDADLLTVRILGGASGVCASFGRAEYGGVKLPAWWEAPPKIGGCTPNRAGEAGTLGVRSMFWPAEPVKT